MMPKVVIVAGGLAKRMMPVAEQIPKCLVDINGKPLILHQIEFFKKNGFTEFIFCIAHLANKVEDYFNDGSRFGVNIQYSQDQLSGTAGAVKLVENMVRDVCIVYYGDNLTTMNFHKLLDFHTSKKSDFTVVVKPSAGHGSSLVRLADSSRVTSFTERQTAEDLKTPGSNYINNGIYIMNKNIFSLIPPKRKYDFGYNLIPDLVRKKFNVYGYITHEFFREIGRLEKYEKFMKEVNNREVLK